MATYGRLNNARKYLLILALALLVFGATMHSAAAAAGNATSATNNTASNSTNATKQQQPLQPPGPVASQGVVQQEITVQLNSESNARTAAKTNAISIGIIVIGLAGILGGTNYNRKNMIKRAKKSRSKA